MLLYTGGLLRFLFVLLLPELYLRFLKKNTVNTVFIISSRSIYIAGCGLFVSSCEAVLLNLYWEM